ncbi:MAG: TetR family transcriptional regulator [Actinomycetaceae bacterium]|nr:TetR family transcriptional regulator [Actinomycetaceae bacterium]
MAVREPKSIKAQITKASLIIAAAGILREQGPEAVTYRYVAKVAGLSSSSAGYYFNSISDLLHEAGKHNIEQWAQRAEETVADARTMAPEKIKKHRIEIIMNACLPHDETAGYSSHYSQLIAASNSSEVTDAYREGRQRLDGAVQEILELIDWNMPARLIIAVVDGAAVAAISEGRDVCQNVTDVLAELSLLNCDKPYNET